jgi:hypothetical protein
VTTRLSGSPPHSRRTIDASIGWGRAAASALVILAVGAGLLIYLPNWVLTHLSGLSRHARVAVATLEFLVSLAAMSWALRRLQRGHVV